MKFKKIIFVYQLSGSIEYLRTKIILLKEHELIININCNGKYSKLNFKEASSSWKVFESSATHPTKWTKTAQLCMLSSLTYKCKNVIYFIPVDTIRVDQSKTFISDVTKQFEALGFRFVSVISDKICC